MWDYRFGGTGLDVFTCIEQTDDKGFLLGGYSKSGLDGDISRDSIGGNDYWIIKIDSLGIKQWDKRYGGTKDDALFSLCLTSDGGYLLGGFSN